MPVSRRALVALVAAALLGAAPAVQQPKPTAVTAYPATVELHGPRAVQLVGVLATYDGERQADLSREATFRVESSKVAVVEKGVVRPVADGSTTLTIEAGGRSVSVPVRVKGVAADAPVSFPREVTAVLTRSGCNAGSCHGAQHGKGGFRLSLFGFDPEFDHSQIVQSSEGRRIVLSDPERSILLQKPILTMDHTGGA